jgi:flagellar protein FlbD
MHQPLFGAADTSISSREGRVEPMIELTKLNGNPMMLNCDLIKTAEASPDTMLTLVNGEKLIVREDCADVAQRVLAYRARLLAAVARKLNNFDEVARIASLCGMDGNGQVAPGCSPKREGHPGA